MSKNPVAHTFWLSGSSFPRGLLGNDELILTTRFNNGEVVVSRLKVYEFANGSSSSAEAHSKMWVVGQLFYDAPEAVEDRISIPQGGGKLDHPLAQIAVQAFEPETGV